MKLEDNNFQLSFFMAVIVVYPELVEGPQVGLQCRQKTNLVRISDFGKVILVKHQETLSRF